MRTYFQEYPVVSKASGEEFQAKLFSLGTGHAYIRVDLFQGDSKVKTVKMATLTRGYKRV